MTDSEPRREHLLIGITSLGHFLCHLGELAFMGVMLAVKEELDLDPGMAAVLPMLGFVLMGVGALPVGLWADWCGPGRLLQVYFLSLAAAAGLVALSSGVGQLFVALTALGLALSIYHPVGLALLAAGVKEHGRAMGINGVAGSVGVATGPLLGFAAAALGWWRGAFVALAVLSLLGAVLTSLARRHLGDLEPRSLRPRVVLAPVTDPWRRRLPMILLCLSMLLGGFNYRCLVTALPKYCSGDEVTSSSLLAGGQEVFLILLLGGCLGQYLGGWAIDRLGAWAYPVFIVQLAPCGLALAVAEGTTAGTLVATFLAFNLFAQQPIENALLARWTPHGRQGLSYGAKIALTFGFGALGSLVTGMIWQEAKTPAPVFFLFAATAAVMVLLVTMALRQRHLLDRVETDEEQAEPDALPPFPAPAPIIAESEAR